MLMFQPSPASFTSLARCQDAGDGIKARWMAAHCVFTFRHPASSLSRQGSSQGSASPSPGEARVEQFFLSVSSGVEGSPLS